MTLITNICRFEITDGDGNVALKILGPWCTYSCAGDVEFKVVETLVYVLLFYLFLLCANYLKDFFGTLSTKFFFLCALKMDPKITTLGFYGRH